MPKKIMRVFFKSVFLASCFKGRVEENWKKQASKIFSALGEEVVNLFDVLKGFEKGISEADSNLGIYQETLSKREAAKLENLLKKPSFTNCLLKRAKLKKTIQN